MGTDRCLDIRACLKRLERFDDAAVTRLLGDAVVGLGARNFTHEVAVPLVHRAAATIRNQ
jgi:hypothetical protein